MPPPVFRFAPSPNGYLHLGHAFSALLNSDLAHQAGGRLLLRIEDIDVTRCKPEFEAAIYEDLAWLGIAWETPTSYPLSVVLGDALQGVTEVVRGQDLFWSTGVHRLLQQLLGLPEPAYRHHRLILDAAGRKLSKSTEATGLRELRAAGATPADIRRLVSLP